MTLADRPFLWKIVAVALTASAGVVIEKEPGLFPTGPSLANSTVWLPSALDKNPEYDVVPEAQDKVVVAGSHVIASVGFAAPPGAASIALVARAASSVPSVSLFMPSPLVCAARRRESADIAYRHGESIRERSGALTEFETPPGPEKH